MAGPNNGGAITSITAKTGNAQIEKLGHTSNTRLATNPHVADDRPPVKEEKSW